MRPLDRDTIVAPATVFGQGGIGIIRISGEKALSILERFFRRKAGARLPFTSHQLCYGHFCDHQGNPIDEAMAVFMKGPYSYTREDVVEIHCHGGRAIGARIIETAGRAGCRPAQPGEFTLRAFLNGRIDLSQAEGVMENIEAQTVAAQKIALRHLDGSLKEFCAALREELADCLALIETWLDFPEEDIDHPSHDLIFHSLRHVATRLEELLDTYAAGRVIRDGVGVLILGKPNVGKSSLLNSLVGRARAIVTEIPGTTRDIIEEQLEIEGLRVRLIDTAGVRVSDDVVEQEGVRRAQDKVNEADLILFVVDGSAPVSGEDLHALEFCPREKVFLVVNKCDLSLSPLPSPLESFPRVAISARTGDGIPLLLSMIRDKFVSDSIDGLQEGLILTEERHRACLHQCLDGVARGLDSLHKGLSLEFLALEIRGALDALGEITGETAPEEILNRIFSRFCIGK